MVPTGDPTIDPRDRATAPNAAGVEVPRTPTDDPGDRPSRWGMPNLALLYDGRARRPGLDEPWTPAVISWGGRSACPLALPLGAH